MTELSVLLYLDTGDTGKLEKCAESIFHSSALPREEFQLILLDPHPSSSGVSREEWLKRQWAGRTDAPDVTNMEAVQAYNRGLELAEGRYVLFMPSSSCFGADSLKKLMKQAKTSGDNLLSFRPEFSGEGGNPRDYREILPAVKELDAESDSKQIQLILQAYLIRREFLGDLRFQEELHEDAFYRLLLQLLMKNRGRAAYRKDAVYYYSEPALDDTMVSDLPETEWWYGDSVRNFLLDTMEMLEQQYEGNVPVYLQSILYYVMCVKYKVNLSGNDKLMLKGEEVDAFFDLCCELLTKIDNEIIYQNGDMFKMKLPRALRILFLQGKARKLGCRLERKIEGNTVLCSMKTPDGGTAGQTIVIGDLGEEILNVQVINYRKGCLELDCFFQGAAFLEEGSFEVYGKLEGAKGQRIEPERSEVYSLLKCFGVTYGKKYALRFKLPVEAMLEQKSRFAVYVKCGNKVNRLMFKFSSMNSRLLTYSQKAYWRFDRNRYILERKGNFLSVTKSSPLQTLKRELLLEMALFIQCPGLEAITCVLVRLLYWLTRPYYKRKRIWLTFDKLYKAGDNGEYFFQYCQRQKDGIDCYYVINRNAPDRERLEAEHGKHILYANSWKCRFMALQAEAVMATHAGTATYLGFPVPLHKYFKDLYQSDNICIQHGLSIQKIAHFQNRLYANTRLYCCASPFERDNVAKPIYGYEPEMLKMTGLARYDGLRSREKKQILITPTWRKNVVHTKGVGMTNSHSSYFKETAYYRIYNSLINDEKLIRCAKEHGYGIIFLLHPAMSAQLEDYDRNDHVQLIQATGDMSYEKILTESSLMVTDYSGVQFDFAYQRKPLVYYHPSQLPPHYTEGGLIYDTMGFGPICTEHEELIDCLCGYMESGCRMEEVYKKRADQFFAFDDFDSAKRIYQEVIRFESEK